MQETHTLNICFLCLSHDNIVNIETETILDQVKWKDKLEFCVAELNWDISCFICSQCSSELDAYYTFRKKVIKSYSQLSSEYNYSLGDTEDCQDVLQESEDVQPRVENEFICIHCGEGFKSKEVLTAHIETHSSADDEKKYGCDTCSSVLTTRKKLEIHKVDCSKVEEKNDIKKLKVANSCETCGLEFSTKYLLNRHVKNVHATEKKHNCDVCGQKFASAVYLSAHKKYHSGNRPHICSFCGKGYITTSDLYHHEKIHANKRAYKCVECPKAFNTSSDLHKHKICVHIDRSEWKYVCSHCDRRFPLKINLDTHTKTHTGERNYACHLCERRCINRSVLLKHIESHSNVRSFKCEHCSQTYKYQKSLNIHLAKTHSIGDAKIPERVKKYFCHICPKSYFANNKLQKHIRSHTGERPFSCDICDKKFIDKSYVKQHLKASHNVLHSI
ncbi:PREDICTED: zinc finger protein 664 [Nicrophorus vespilloides]|uniref:Zinc finger protein 664 n=1 Tax=Nicrophorus vespilloides TaxID=110193 RepID=A0ABM1M3P4_NICVS|nr:PREDICTED: zinc finger protein 664 [Nicrophorus vespilloides]